MSTIMENMHGIGNFINYVKLFMTNYANMRNYARQVKTEGEVMSPLDL